MSGRSLGQAVVARGAGASVAAVVVVWTLLSVTPLWAQRPSPPVDASSLGDEIAELPEPGRWQRVLLLRDYNTRVVVFGTFLLGMASGLVGSFTLLRRRALMGDALAHATLPGIGLAFTIATAWGADGKALPVLLAGAAVTGLMGVASILFIRNFTRLKEDAALGIVLSVYFGAGVAVLGVVQQMETGHAAGLEAFIYGKTASMIAADAKLIGGSAVICFAACGLLFKELKLLCFDEAFAGSRGFPVLLLDMALMGLVVTITIVGLQAVGLVLMIALLVIPAAAARFWTERMQPLALLSAFLGGLGGLVGASVSALFPKLPSGAMIVLTASFFFLISMFLGTQRGVLIRSLRRRRLNRRIDRQHLLRELYESLEASPSAQRSGRGEVDIGSLLENRSWSLWRLNSAIDRAVAEGLIEVHEGQCVVLTDAGHRQAAQLTRRHRLWELYLITHADIAPSRVDRDADAIEHVLEPEMVAELESLLPAESGQGAVPASPHQLTTPAPSSEPDTGEQGGR